MDLGGNFPSFTDQTLKIFWPLPCSHFTHQILITHIILLHQKKNRVMRIPNNDCSIYSWGIFCSSPSSTYLFRFSYICHNPLRVKSHIKFEGALTFRNKHFITHQKYHQYFLSHVEPFWMIYVHLKWEALRILKGQNICKMFPYPK